MNGDEAVIKSGKDKINDNEDEFKGDGEVFNDNGVIRGNGEALKDDEGA